MSNSWKRDINDVDKYLKKQRKIRLRELQEEEADELLDEIEPSDEILEGLIKKFSAPQE